MAKLKITIYKSGASEPDTTVSIPVGVLKLASKLIPKRAANALLEKGIDLDEIVRLSQNPDLHGTIVTVEEHKSDEKIVISLE